MSSNPPSLEMDEVRSRAQSLLSSSGSAQNVKSEVQAMAGINLPLSEKYHHLAAETMLRENVTAHSKQEVLDALSKLVKALSILEKYGCNLTCPARPRYWRSVKHNNPVFRSTVDAMKGGRRVLFLYGYTNQQIDGLSFPDEVSEPDAEKVSAVTLEVMALRTEVDMIIKGTHPHLETFKDILPSLMQQDTVGTDLVGAPPAEEQQGDKPQVLSPSPKPVPRLRVGEQPLKPSTGSPAAKTCSICGISAVYAQCSTCVQRLCVNCDKLFHSHPDRKGHNRTIVTPAKTSSPSLSPWECGHCTTVNEMRAVLCSTCERPRLATAASMVQDSPMSVPTSPNTEWQCKSCTVVNQGSSILCEVCERPRLATRPPVASLSSNPGSLSDTGAKWTCQYCTYVNIKPTVVCEMCNLPCKDSPGDSLPESLQQTPSITKDLPQSGVRPFPKPRVNMELKRQKTMREDGLSLIHHIREAEKRGVSPEEVYAALCMCGSSNISPCDWLTSELPHLLDEICAMAASVQLNLVERDGEELEESGPSATGEDVKLSRAEAKLAWLAAGGDADKAVKQLLRDRQVKMRELQTLGFRDVAKCEEALRQSGGEVKGALSLLQRPLLEPFHQRIWTDQPEPPIDPKHPDKQDVQTSAGIVRPAQLGRCELVLSLLQEPGVSYSLEDVVQAVKESHDKDFIRRLLNNECPCCLSIFPRSKMQSLTSCQCSVCHECFSQHFTIAVRDKHIRDMVCPVCSEPDINDPEQLDSYFSTLDIQLRDCLETEVYELFHKKLTEHALMKDPKFLWCCHCTFGFINDGDQLKVTCLSCRNSFCAQCKKPWEPQHQDLSCEQFQQWKRENDPEYQRQGLAGYLRDNGITCPHCRFQYDLTKGGCMHFSCSQCRYQFCSGCNNPYHKTGCKTPHCTIPGLHAHHPRDCLFYLRDWEPARLQTLLQRSGVEFNTDPSDGTQTDACGVMEQKDEGGHQIDSPCGVQTQPGHAGLCDKHYREYLVSLINNHSLDPALLYDAPELIRACERYQVDTQRGENEEDNGYHARLLKKLMEVPLGEKVPRMSALSPPSGGPPALPVYGKPRDFWEKERLVKSSGAGSAEAQSRLHCTQRAAEEAQPSLFRAMPAGRMRSTRRLRSWIVEQVSSGKYPGLVWDDEAKTMFRIPWKHAGKQDFRKDEDAAIFKAWAAFKGKLTDGSQDNPASWKTRLRCALNKSEEFEEVMDRAQLDISEPYKVYRLVPFSEQGEAPSESSQMLPHTGWEFTPPLSWGVNAAGRFRTYFPHHSALTQNRLQVQTRTQIRAQTLEAPAECEKRRTRKLIQDHGNIGGSDCDIEDVEAAADIRDVSRHLPGRMTARVLQLLPQSSARLHLFASSAALMPLLTPLSSDDLLPENLRAGIHCVEDALLHSDITIQTDEPVQHITTNAIQADGVVDEIRLDVRIEEPVPAPQEDQDSFSVAIQYLGQEVLKRQIQGTDVRITYLPSSLAPPTPAVLKGRFPRIPLPEPPSTLPASQELQALFTLLPFMEKGVVLTSGRQGVYGKRFCQGRVFWTGPHTITPGPHKMERNSEPVLLFSKEVFKQQLDHFRSNGGEPPECSVTLCFGEELSNTEDPTSKLIIVKITLPWAEQEVHNAQSFLESITILQSLASQSPLGEITLNLVTVPTPTSDMITCGTL
ncbi:hypothetical protein INR49_012148 [Caranx melampygus]|nr:hypothetical protein INR49_012148 [Caranx melampygus]